MRELFSKMNEKVIKYGKIRITVVLIVLFVFFCLLLNIYYLLSN